MNNFVLGLAVLALVGCGAAGAPLRPVANLGLSIGPNGVTPNASVGARSDNVSINVDL